MIESARAFIGRFFWWFIAVPLGVAFLSFTVHFVYRKATGKKPVIVNVPDTEVEGDLISDGQRLINYVNCVKKAAALPDAQEKEALAACEKI